MLISELRKRSNSFVAQLPKIIEKAVNYNEEIENLNKSQLQESILATGAPISPDYSPSYAHWKSTVYPESYGSGKVNLFLTGDLYKDMDLVVKYPNYLINTMVPYAPKLAKKYSDKIFGIAPKNRQRAQEITSKLIAEQYKQMVL